MDWHSLGRSFLSFYFIYIVICISNLPNGCNASVFSETYFWQCGCEIHTKSHLVPLIRFPSPIRLVSYWNMQLTGYWLYTTSSWNVYNYKSVYLWKTLKKKKENFHTLHFFTGGSWTYLSWILNMFDLILAKFPPRHTFWWLNVLEVERWYA